MIPYGRQWIDDSDINAVVEVLRSSYLTQGPVVESFEQAVSSRCGAKFGIAVSSATSALYLAYRALGLGPGGLLWTSPNTFVASSNAALLCGAKVDFVDIDPDSLNMSIPLLKKKLELAKLAGNLPSIVVPVHFAGRPCNMVAIKELSTEFGFKVVEDASHAIGATYHEESIGNCRFSDAVVFSFHAVKVITTGEGGMVLCKDENIANSVRLLRTHGITRDHNFFEFQSEGPWYYEQIDLGFNHRITDIQAALGSNQLLRLDEFLDRRRELANNYHKQLTSFSLRLPIEDTQESMSSWHLYVVQLDTASNSFARKTLFEMMHSADIGANVHYRPVHLNPYYHRLGFNEGQFPFAETYYRNTITLPLHPKMSKEDQNRVVDVIEEFFRICK